MMSSDWEPPQSIETIYEKAFSMGGMNRPTTGKRSEEELPVGSAAFQLYSLATPNGQKIGILLEELEIPYDAHVINIGHLEQFSKGFVGVNPNSKIPAAMDHAPVDGGPPLRLFESGAIMLYLAEKYKKFIPQNPRQRAECMSWVMWQMAGQGPMTGNFGHFMVYAPGDKGQAREYGVARYGMEVQRLCDTLDKHLEGKEYICGEEYSIADMIILPWFDIIRGKGYTHANGVAARNFLNMKQYKNANRWAGALLKRPQVKRGMLVCRGKPKPWLVDDRFEHLAKL
jgi:GST-like protein